MSNQSYHSIILINYVYVIFVWIKCTDKDYWLSLPLEEKRKQYKSGLNFLTLDEISTWPELYKKNSKFSKNAIAAPVIIHDNIT